MNTGGSNPVVLEDVQTKLVKPTVPVIGRVVSNELCMNGKSASFVKHTTFDVAGTPLAGAFRAGQAFGVIPPGEDENGKPHKVRLYSLASPSWGEDGDGNVISTTPKRLVEEFAPQTATDDPSDHHLFMGICSNYLCSLKPGDEVCLSGPNGKRFQLPADHAAHDYLFLATGTGIAPFRGMLMELLQGSAGACDSQIHLVMGSPYTTDLLYHDLFEGLASQHSNFHYHTAISREPRGEGRRGLYVDALLDEWLDSFRTLFASPRTLIYVCGLAGMQLGLFQMLARHDLDAGYCTRSAALMDTDPTDWDSAAIKRGMKPTPRCMLEVY
jgi:ferredoxin--NADP+ reductase